MLVWGVNFNHLQHKMITHLIQESGFLSWKNKIQIVSCQIVTLDKQLLIWAKGRVQIMISNLVLCIMPHPGYVLIAFYCKTRKDRTGEEASIVRLFVMTTRLLFNEVYHKHRVWRHLRGQGEGGSYYIRPHCIKQTGFEYPSWTKPKAKLYQGCAHIWWPHDKVGELTQSSPTASPRPCAAHEFCLDNKIKVLFTCLIFFNMFFSIHKSIEVIFPLFFLTYFWLRERCHGVTLGTRTARARRTKAADGCPAPVDDYVLHRQGPLRLVLGGIHELEVNDQNMFSYQ